MKKFHTGVILAGGKSTRMGFDKQLLSVNKIRLVNQLIKKLKDEFQEIIVVTNTPGYYIDLSCKIVSDEIKEKGPLSGIHIGLKQASSEYVYFLACDMPNINLDYIRFMKDTIMNREVDACITKLGDWLEPFNAFYSKKIIQEIERYLQTERRSIFSLMKQLNCIYIDEKQARQFSPNWDMFFNINTKEDIGKYLSLTK